MLLPVKVLNKCDIFPFSQINKRGWGKEKSKMCVFFSSEISSIFLTEKFLKEYLFFLSKQD